MELGKRVINGINVYTFKSKDQLLMHLNEVDKGILFAVNARKIMTSPDHIKEEINNNIGYIDGIGTIWALRRKGFSGQLGRIPGVELWLDIIKKFSNKRFFLIGAKEDVITKVIKKLKSEIPDANIVGYRNGYFDCDEHDNIIGEIKSKKADFIFVAMGSPKQEQLMIDLSKKYEAIYMGLGGSFDVYSGNVKRAPLIFQYTGLEGPYRIIKNPGRLLDRKIFYFRYFYKLILGKF